MAMRVIILITVLLGILNAEKREALLIANNIYEHREMGNLQDVSGNLRQLESALEAVGFSVKIETNLDNKRLKQAIDRFSNRLAKSSDTIGFFYYAGHGCQVENVGYLIPTNVNTQKKIDIKYDALNIDKMIETFDSAGNKLNMLFLDACRNIPTGARGGTRGLAQAPLTPKGTMVVYATEAGRTADDNTNFINSLVSNLQQPNQSIKDMADNISNSVADMTNERQIPVVFYKRLPRPKVVLKHGYVSPTPKPKTRPTSKWITPTNKVCKANGGKITNEVCGATWKNSKKICSASGASLPSIDDLRKVVTDCGGVIDDYINNINNSNYQTCYKQKGFTSSWYWSSTEINSSLAWGVDFRNGNDDCCSKTVKIYALCVR